ncbi:MAG: hypothetical protein NUV63_04240 [Gallionella sp.]|nr:hypothetical protein [Gallionella sp.]
MSAFQTVAGTLLAFATVGASADAFASDVDVNLRADLQHIAQRKIFFGHRSVGRNLLDGVSQLSNTAGIPVHMAETQNAGGVGPATFGHALVDRNGDPFLKIRSFEQAMGQQPTGLDIALVKFCYVDFTANTDAKALFSRYQTAINDLKARNPGTAFVHVTAPLTTVQGGFKQSLKRLLGRAPYGTLENMRREEYNSLMREAYKGREPIFDIARIESTAPDGSAVSTEWNGNVAPAMFPSYTDDGGHLNTTGRLRAARELVSVLAAIPDQPVIGKQTR